MPPKIERRGQGVGLLVCRRGADRTAAAPMMDSMGRWLARCDECAHEWTDQSKASKVRCLPCHVLSVPVSPVCCAAACLPEQCWLRLWRRR